MWPGVSITRASSAADARLVVLADGLVDQRNAGRFAVRRDHAAAMALLELRDATGVVL